MDVKIIHILNERKTLNTCPQIQARLPKCAAKAINRMEMISNSLIYPALFRT